MDKKLQKRNWMAEVAFLAVKEHIVLLTVADLTLPYNVHFLLVSIFTIYVVLLLEVLNASTAIS